MPGMKDVEYGTMESQTSRHSIIMAKKSSLKSSQHRASVKVDNEGASVMQCTFNLVKNIIGGGVLSLSHGLAAGTGSLPAAFFAILLGSLSGYMFSLVGRICSATGQNTFKGLGEATGGPRFAMAMGITCTLKTFMTCLSYSIVIADLFSAILESQGILSSERQGIGLIVIPRVLFSTADSTYMLSNRTFVLVAVTIFVITPLCLLKDLSLLAYTSLAGISGMLYTTMFVVKRYVDGTYAPGTGQYYHLTDAKFQPQFDDSRGVWALNIKTLVLVCSLSTAFIAHYNAPKFYGQLRDRTVSRFNLVVSVSFGVAMVVFSIVMFAGYLTFGTNANGNLLNNYSSEDMLATVARVAVFASTVFTYPLAFTGLRDGVMSLFGLPQNSFQIVTIGLLIPISALAWCIPKLGFVNSFGGAVFGALIIYIFPSLLFVFAVDKKVIHGRPFEVCFAKILMACGVLLVLLGSVVSILDEFTQVLK